ncbi:MAG: hypothetical protein M1828_006723 [Chrysothrix sp. TS-e1954]|nr:MAG: hypothetical protein M1828_006723 [Chrysothrix sp. TS-e1954]
MSDCKGDECSYGPCQSYRRVAGYKPYRKLSRLSARAAALALAANNSDLPENEASQDQCSDGPIIEDSDPRSFHQQLVSRVDLSIDAITRLSHKLATTDVVPGIGFASTLAFAARTQDSQTRCLARKVCFETFSDPVQLSRCFSDLTILVDDDTMAILSMPPIFTTGAKQWQANNFSSPFPSFNPFLMYGALRWWIRTCSDEVYENLCQSIERLPLASLDDAKATRCILICLEALAAMGPSSSQHAGLVSQNEVFENVHDTVFYERWDNEAANRLVVALFRYLAGFLGPLRVLNQVTSQLRAHLRSLLQFFYTLLHTYNDFRCNKRWAEEIVLRGWCQHLFLKGWDGRSALNRSSIEANALLVLEFLASCGFSDLTQTRDEYIISRLWYYDMPCQAKVYGYDHMITDPDKSIIPKVDPLAFAKSWLHLFATVEVEAALATRPIYDCLTEPMPVMRFLWLFDGSVQMDCFRALCWLRMQKAVEQARLNSTLLGNSLGWQRSSRGSGDPRTDWPINPSILTLLESPSPSWQIGLRKAFTKFMTLKVRRAHLLFDAFEQLWHVEKRELLRPLKVEIDNEGEAGYDAGGVAQEFFSLALQGVFDPSYGIFTIDEQSRLAWFDPKSLEPMHKYELLGLLMGLALHNGFTLPLAFPTIFYKKLRGPVSDLTLRDIEDGWPALSNGLTELLEYTGDVENDLCRTYVFSFPTFAGQSADVDMTGYGPNDAWSASETILNHSNASEAAISVTAANRERYVRDYLFWLLDKSIRPQFHALAKGFYTVIPRSHIQMLPPRTLQDLIEGEQDIDATDLQAATSYIDFRRKNHTVQAFWRIVHGFSQQRRRDLLHFVTGSERVPLGGVERLEFTVQRNGSDSESLPTAQTCFGRLLLPEYGDTEKLRRKLEIALDNSVGFGNR